VEIRKLTLGETHAAHAEGMNLLAKVYLATERRSEALSALTSGMLAEQTNIKEVFNFSTEAAMRAYLLKVSGSLGLLINTANPGSSTGDGSTESALTWTLRRKGVIFDALYGFQRAQAALEKQPTLAASVARLRNIKQTLADLQLRPTAETDAEAFRAHTQHLREEADRLQSDLNRSLAAVASIMPDETIDTGSVRRHLPAHSALVELVRANKLGGKPLELKTPHYFAFVLTPDTRPVRMFDLGEADSIDRGILEVRRNVELAARQFRREGLQTEKSLEEEFRNTSAELYKLVFAPIREALGTATTIYVAPEGEFNRLAFEALVDNDGKYLIESYRFAYLSSGRDLLKMWPQPGRGTLVFAAPDYDLRASERVSETRAVGSATAGRLDDSSHGTRSSDTRGLRWDRLSGTEAEASDVNHELADSRFGPVKLYLGKAALEGVFKGARSPRILHVATHGFFLANQTTDQEDRAMPVANTSEFGAAAGLARLRGAENPFLRSGIVLAGANVTSDAAGPTTVDDGWVTAEEIAMMDLRGTELVVLSACESGLGDIQVGEGVYGLRRAFQLAGAKLLLTSLFKVPDDQTREIMSGFYRGLKAGKNEGDALRDSQLELVNRRRQAKGAAHPFFWASFVLVGDPHQR
jgi:CHAT domain-containing protein